MAEDTSFLRDIFNVYYEKAKVAHANGNLELAKRNYYLAAETLLKIAKNSTPALKKAQYDRAMRLQNIAEDLEKRQIPKSYSTKPASSSSNTFNPELKEQNEEEDNGKEWQSAEIPNLKFSDVAGLDDVKKTITTRVINPLKYPDKYAKYGKKSGGGVLLYGPPGTGKTMIAKAIAGEVGATFFAVKGSDIMSKWVGESEKNISSLFEAARKEPMAIIFIDEMDSLFGARGRDTHNDKRVNEFLQQIDGFASKAENLLLLGATNRPWDVDSAAVRSGRFSEKIYVTLPDDKAREFLLRKYLGNAPLDKDINWEMLVKFTKGYSGADIAEVCDKAKEEPLNKYIETNQEVPVSMINVLEAIKKVKPTVKEKDIKVFDDYAGITSNVEKEPVLNEKEEDDVFVTFASRNVSIFPGTYPVLKFTLSKDFEKVYINVDGSNYICKKELNSWTSEPIKIDESGEYEVIISSQNEIAREKIKFTKGLEEDDLGL